MAGKRERILQILSEPNSSIENESSALEDDVPQKLSTHDIAVLSLDHKRSFVSQLVNPRKCITYTTLTFILPGIISWM